MKFAIHRTSTPYDKKPCDNAYRGEREQWDLRTSKTFEEFEDHLGECFTHRGSDHGLHPGGIKRRLGMEKCWCIDIDSLDDLLALTAKYGEVIVEVDEHRHPDMHTLEIYDDYRE